MARSTRTPVDRSGGHAVDTGDYTDYPDYYGGDPVGNSGGWHARQAPDDTALKQAGLSPRSGRPRGSTAISAATGTQTVLGGDGAPRTGTRSAARNGTRTGTQALGGTTTRGRTGTAGTAATGVGGGAGARRAGGRRGAELPPEKGIRGWWHRRARWFRWLTIAALAGFVLLAAAAAGLLYAIDKVTIPEPSATSQISVITFANGNDTIAKLGNVNRTEVPLSAISVPARNAVLAAEDKNYYSEPGISYRGILRALYTDLRGGSVSQGGSTITQQYAKNAFLTQNRTISRKLKEIGIAIKLDKKYSKDKILELYLNRIYFGRGAYGIQAAAKTYFGVDASKLNAEQAAVIAGLIRSPNVLDPRVSQAAAKKRWREVLITMQQKGWISPAELAADTEPPVTKKVVSTVFGVTSPQYAYIRDEVKTELAAHGISSDLIARGGLKIITTLDKKREDDATAAVTQVTNGAQPDLQSGLVSVDPKTGGIVAWYGGTIYGQSSQPDPNTPRQKYADYVDNLVNPIQPGSSFKPIVLATALEHGVKLNQTFDSSSPKAVPGYPGGLHNFTNPDGTDEQYGKIDLIKATAESVNTIYVPLGWTYGDQDKAVVTTAHAMGVTSPLEAVPSLALGTFGVKPVDMAAVYSTFASGGYQVTPHLVLKVFDRDGKVIYQAPGVGKRVVPAPVVNDATFAMQHVLTEGTAEGSQLANGRIAAGKTGTTTDDKSALFCGFTPQLATCSVMFRDHNKPLQNILGVPEVSGGTLPAKIWKAYMDPALAGLPNLPFPAPTSDATAPPPAPVVTAPPTTAAPQPTQQAPNPTPTHHKHHPTPPPTQSTPPTQSPDPEPTTSGQPTTSPVKPTGPPRNTPVG